MSDTKVPTPEQIAELRAAIAAATQGPMSMWGGRGWPKGWDAVPDAEIVWPIAQATASTDGGYVAAALSHEDQRLLWLLWNAAPALLDAAERCARYERYGLIATDVARDAAVQRAEAAESALTTAIARAEAAEKERESLMARIEEVSGVTAAECPLSVEAALAALDKLDRMRPVVEAAVAEYRAADAANDETEPDDTQVQRNGRWAKAETTLHIAVHNYLDGAHAKGGG